FRSTARDLFRRERARILCFACKAPAPWPKAMKRLVVWGAVGVAAAACVWAGTDLDSQVYTLIVLSALVLSSPLAIVVHEFGHVAAGRLVGRKIYFVALGIGDSLKTFQIGEMQISVGRELHRGYVCGFPVRPEARWRTSLYYLGGALANLAA